MSFRPELTIEEKREKAVYAVEWTESLLEHGWELIFNDHNWFQWISPDKQSGTNYVTGSLYEFPDAVKRWIAARPQVPLES